MVIRRLWKLLLIVPFQSYNPTFLVTQSNQLLEQYQNQQQLPVVQLFKPAAQHAHSYDVDQVGGYQGFMSSWFYNNRSLSPSITTWPVLDRSKPLNWRKRIKMKTQSRDSISKEVSKDGILHIKGNNNRIFVFQASTKDTMETRQDRTSTSSTTLPTNKRRVQSTRISSR